MKKIIFILITLVLIISPLEIAIASPSNSVQADVDRAMIFAPQISRVLKRSKNSYGSMIRQVLSRFQGVGSHEPFMIALMAKESGGRKMLINENYIGLYQILGFGPFQLRIDKLGEPVDNRRFLTKPKRNIIQAILLLDKIFEEIWQPVVFYNIELIKIAKRFHCTPNRYSEIIKDCDDGQSWAEDFYYRYLPIVNDIWYFQ